MFSWRYEWWANLLWYGRRPWHWLFGHGACQEFLDAEGCHPSTTAPITSHFCCECGLPCKER